MADDFIGIGSGGYRLNKNDMFTAGASGNTRHTARIAKEGVNYGTDVKTNWGSGASRSLYNVFSSFGSDEAKGRDLLKSRLWKGVPQLTGDQMKAFEAAYTGHTFLFVVGMPAFMTKGIYTDKNLHQQARNLKAVIERASTGFSGQSNIIAEFDTQNDGYGRKLDHVTKVTKEQSDITIRLHEFAGLPVKNAIESWLTGIYDYRSEHGHYHGNLGIPGGWCIQNHSMSLLVVQTDPTWTEIQDAAYYYNMIPQEVPFEHFNWEKGEHQIIQDYDLVFKCNEERSPAIMFAAEKYMNNRILSMVQTSVFNSRQFVADRFGDDKTDIGTLSAKGAKNEYYNGDSNILDANQYNVTIKNTQNTNNGAVTRDWVKPGNNEVTEPGTNLVDSTEVDGL